MTFIFHFVKAAAATAKSLQSCPTLCDPHRQQPARFHHPWDSPGKNTGVGCHFPLHCMKVKSESEVTQSCPTLSDPMDCSPPGSSIHGIFQARVLEWGAIAFSICDRWIDIEGILLSEMSQRKKDKCFMTSLVESKSNRLLETERRMVIARGGGIGDIGKCWLNSTDSS